MVFVVIGLAGLILLSLTLGGLGAFLAGGGELWPGFWVDVAVMWGLYLPAPAALAVFVWLEGRD